MAESRVETISYVRSELEKLGNDELSGQFEATCGWEYYGFSRAF